MNKKFLIDGHFVTETLTGIKRMALETLYALDEMEEAKAFEVVVPNGYGSELKELNTIKVFEFGSYENHRKWIYTVPKAYAKKNNMKLVNIASAYPFQTGSCVMIADVRLSEGLFDETLRWKITASIKNILAVRFCKKIATLSEFSKERIVKIFHADPQKIEVIPCGWQHFERIIPDFRVFEKFPQIMEGSYFYSVGSLAPHKNYKWIIENARFNPDYQYVITGGKRDVWKSEEFNLPNIIYTGYLSDEEMKAVMMKSKAFIFPTLYEGFGIPPLEALSAGVRCVVSDIPCLKEVYGDTVQYLDPREPKVDLNNTLNATVRNAAEVLEKYSWKNASKRWVELLYNM